MQGMVGMAIGVLALVVVYVIIPLIGSQMDTAVVLPGYINQTAGTTNIGSEWNNTVNPNVPTAVGLWTAVAGIIKVGAILVIIGGFLRTLQGLRS